MNARKLERKIGLRQKIPICAEVMCGAVEDSTHLATTVNMVLTAFLAVGLTFLLLRVAVPTTAMECDVEQTASFSSFQSRME